jgi:hypothetical protein
MASTHFFFSAPYPDDLAIITSNQDEIQELISSLCDFLKFNGVTLSADEKVSKSKTITSPTIRKRRNLTQLHGLKYRATTGTPEKGTKRWQKR